MITQRPTVRLQFAQGPMGPGRLDQLVEEVGGKFPALSAKAWACSKMK